MCRLYVRFGYKVTFGYVAMGIAVLFILMFRFLLDSAVSGVNRVQVVLSGFSVILFCFVQAFFYVGMVVYISCGCVRVDVMVVSSTLTMT